jgi:hypothetical protein
MSVWSYASSAYSPALHGSEGELVSISVAVEPRDLEDLLEGLAALDFPINPQIYHDAAVVYVAADGNERQEPRTIVEFPAYAGRLQKLRAVLGACGFGDEAISVAPMLDEIHADGRMEPMPSGARRIYRILRKHVTAPAARPH